MGSFGTALLEMCVFSHKYSADKMNNNNSGRHTKQDSGILCDSEDDPFKIKPDAF